MYTPREALITLNLIPGLGSMRIQALLEFFGSAELVLEAPAPLLEQVPRVGPRLAQAISRWQECTNPEAELACAAQYGTRIVTLLDDDYPQALRRMADPPVVLYVRGQMTQGDMQHAVSIVGSRMASPYGMTVARRFARELADAGCTVISGLAHGIDSAAHLGALDSGGRTVAVLGNGLANVFPAENAALAERIENGHGAVLSEFPMGVRPAKTTFPQRNRIVAAWGMATLVVEAPQHSGALHTARLAAENYGRSVFAVPGPVDRPTSVGCHALIRDGAILCTSPHELLEDLRRTSVPRQLDLFGGEGVAEQPPSIPEPPPMPPDPVLKALASGVDTLDALCAATGMAARELTPRLMRLQVEHRIKALPGARYMVVPIFKTFRANRLD
ncbi:MAG: DNA-processing protein DprA [Akkermansia muciniphila]|nr:DNA-processing protein DprA [Akkermansia muciniphila]